MKVLNAAQDIIDTRGYVKNVLEPMGLTVQSHAPMIILDINVKINVTVRITKSAINTSVVKQLIKRTAAQSVITQCFFW